MGTAGWWSRAAIEAGLCPVVVMVCVALSYAPVGLPAGAVGPVATARPPAPDPAVLQITQVDHQGDGEAHHPPKEGALEHFV